MPPKRATRRAGATPQRPHQEPEFESILDLVQGPVLPSVPVQASFNYGAATTTALPQRMSIRPNIGIDQIAGAVDARLEVARKRTAAAKKKQGPQARQSKREPTPDEAQLQQSLHNAAEEHSDQTPSPPVPRSVSTDSSPGAQPPLQRQLSNSPLYPSPLQRAGSPRIHSPLGSSSPFRHSSVDNASEASWNLERDINEDDLQRTRPSKRGRNITAPPRRISGLANVLEEDEEEEEEDVKFDSAIYHDLEPDVPKESFLRRWLGAARHQDQEPQSHNDPPNEVRRKSWMQSFEGAMEGPYRNWIRGTFYLLLFLSCIFMPLIAAKLRVYLDNGAFDWDSSSNISIAKPEVFHSLRSQVSKMDVQMSSLSNEISSVRSKQSLSNIHDSTPTDASLLRKPIYKVNFLSVALGAMIDPAKTSPTLGPKQSAPFRALLWASSFATRRALRAPQSPLSALSKWEEVGDCWCSAPRNGTTQLSVLLGRDIVAEELVVEHIPVGASLEPEAAPRTIELWARFKVNPHKTPVKAKPTSEARPGRGFLKLFGDATVSQAPPSTQAPSSRETGLGGFLIPGIGSLHGLVMDLLRRSNPFEPPSAYSDDPILGPNFYRIGKVEYDLHSPDYAQAFKLNTIVDVSTIRVDKVVFRVTSNWGANHTCIYRFKLHGHL
ncbi:Sad1/UNC-like, C-terminal [Penicillium italicum]|uniref:Sad1/UNC-like, C-terminal n=1 Tax=Penicillium italicum TaxID=40296 RepID=A0A0A2LBW7_PENIT|nr:Sad1/UNC-like, C-terminal [Penicillium italicum]